MAIIEIGGTKDDIVEASEFLYEDAEALDFVLCKSPDKLKLLLEAIQSGKQIHFVCNGDWSLHDLLVELLKEYAPASIYLTTYSIKEFAVRQLINAIEKKQLIGVTLLLENRSTSRNDSLYQMAQENFCKIGLTSIHAKITVIESPKGFITINGSQNLTSNPRIETGVISTSEKLAKFHIDWIQKCIDNVEIFK